MSAATMNSRVVEEQKKKKNTLEAVVPLLINVAWVD